MLNGLIRLSLSQRYVVLALAALLLVVGGLRLSERPTDIFPDLDQPTVTVMVEAPGMAAEEVEALITRRLEATLAGAPDLERMRSVSSEGLCLVRVDFGWGSDPYRARQIVQERLQLAQGELPAGVAPHMAPMSSLTGEVLHLGLTSPGGKVDPMALRTLADWTVRRRLLSVSGVSQVVTIGGEVEQVQVLADPDLLLRHELGLGDVAAALDGASANGAGGYLVDGTRELLVRTLGRLGGVEDVARVVVAGDRRRPVQVRDVARVALGPALKRGTASVDGSPAVLLTVFKQPDADTLELTAALDEELDKLAATLPAGVSLRRDLFRQATFLQRGVDNVIVALRDGTILVVLVLLIFLLDLRAAAVTLVTLPLSFAATGLVFSLLGLSLNTMTLGGLAIAVGELVDDAIVGVENVVRRLRAAAAQPGPLDVLEVVRAASAEVRGPIFSSTAIVVLVFLPLFALPGIEGQLFGDLALAYVVALGASMVVALTVAPVLALLLLGPRARTRAGAQRRQSPVLAFLGRLTERIVGWALRRRGLVLAGSLAACVAAVGAATTLGTEFLPDFDEGTVLVMATLPPGTSLAEGDRAGAEVERRLLGLPGVLTVSRYTGRGEHDEHAPPVGRSHLMLTLDPQSPVPRAEMLARIRERLATGSGAALSIGQPLAHRIDHLLSGVQAQIAVKVTGAELETLRVVAEKVRTVAAGVPGVTDLAIEPLILVPQVHVQLRQERVAELGLNPGRLARELELAIGGRVVAHLLQGERTTDLLLRLEERPRTSLRALRRLPIRLPGGGWARLGELASVAEREGPSELRRDDSLRRLAVSCNVQGRSVGEVVADLRRALGPLQADLPEGVGLRFDGQFASQERATRKVALLSIISLGLVLLLLYAEFRSWNLAVQVLASLPMALVGGVAALIVTGQHFSVAALVGFVSLGAIASRNGVLLMEHYLYLMRTEGLALSADLIRRAGAERAAPVVMTALTTAMGLLPLALGGGAAGREILYPVATVVIGGLASSTLAEFLLRPALFVTFGRSAAQRLCRTPAVGTRTAPPLAAAAPGATPVGD